MLYFEHPAGVGFSYCVTGGKNVTCTWDDKTQAEAYYKTLTTWLTAYPEFKANDMYITGESYAGQYVPNIAAYIMDNAPGKVNLKGFAVGNACWGGDENTVECNGPNVQRNDVDLYYGKGLVAKKLRDQIYTACGWNGASPTQQCQTLMRQMDQEVGPHNIYNIYDNCPRGYYDQLLSSGKSMGWLRRALRDAMPNSLTDERPGLLGGGYDWDCTGGAQGAAMWIQQDEVRSALHLGNYHMSAFRYDRSGPASITLYPQLVKKYRILVYNGDADACVPYKGNEEWTTGLAAKGLLSEKSAWHPWYAAGAAAHIPAGYATTYTVPSAAVDFSFVTIRLAGHMVPTFQPAAAYDMVSRFLAGTPF